MEFEDEIDDILRQLLRSEGVMAAAVLPQGVDSISALVEEGGTMRRIPLAGNAELAVLVANEAKGSIDRRIDQTAGKLASCIRRWQEEHFPEMRLIGRARRSRAMLVCRIGRLLEEFVNLFQANAAIVVRQDVLAMGGRLSEEQRQLIPALSARVDAAAAQARSSHGEISDGDLYGRSFWFGAYFFCFFERPYSVDFVRHRSRAIAREISSILPFLNEEPPCPALALALPDPRNST
ncbi:MAG: hypothetical protein V2A73_15665 [Pseudomonadota bacterium]